MYRISRTVMTETAHVLIGHEGDCANIHGHSYKWTVILEARYLQGGMVTDFSTLKKAMNECIVKVYDHRLVLDINSYNQLKSIVQLHYKLHVMDVRPTAEHMAKQVFDALKSYIPDNCWIKEVRCRETENSEAVYYEE